MAMGRQEDGRVLHVHCGDSSAEVLRRSGVPGDVMVWSDLLLVGPTLRGLSADEWRAVRAQAIVEMAAECTLGQVTEHLAAQDAALARWRDHDEVVFWFDACLYDQTILIHLLDRLAQDAPGTTRRSLICIGEFPGMPRFTGLGELGSAQLARLLPTRHLISADEFTLASAAWRAWCATDPLEIGELLTQDTAALPYLRDALRRQLQEYPSTRTGLGRLEETALRAIAAGHQHLPEIFSAVSAAEERPYFGDTLLWMTLEGMSQERYPLLTLDGPGPLPRFDAPAVALDAWTLTLTETGREVLAGHADRVQLNGLDRWLGGVHLLGRDAVRWWWDPVLERIVERM